MRRGLPDWVNRRFDPSGRFGLRLSLFAIATALVMVPFSFLLVQVTSQGPITHYDSSVALRIHEYVVSHDWLAGVATVVSFFGVPAWFWITIGITAIVLWRRGQWRVALFLGAANILGGVLDTIVKVVVDRPRPEFVDPIAHAFGKSFPSGHTMASTVGYGSLLLVLLPFIPPRRRVLAVGGYFFVVALIGLSRLALGVHFVSDVLGGFVLGMAWLLAATAAFRIWRREQKKRTTGVLEGAEPEVAA